MPISPLVLQRRHAELGRIRLGAKEQFTRRDGSAGTRPAKLDRFRFTSPQRGLIEAVAALYGGTVKAWDSSGKPEFEVLTTAQSLPVIVVKGGLTQWMEFWSSGGCIHRCDGERLRLPRWQDASAHGIRPATMPKVSAVAVGQCDTSALLGLRMWDWIAVAHITSGSPAELS